MSGEVPNQLSLDDHGWPVWPPNDPAVFQSLQRTWDAGEWGSYHTDLHSRCAEQFAKLCRVNDRWATDEMSPWHRYADRIQRDINVRLCSSGSAAVELSLRGVGIKPGDEVIVAAYDYPGNFRTIELLGAKPILVDVRENGVTIDPASLEQIHSDSVRAVIVSHLYGELADVLSIRKTCDERGWHLIEDACQVPGAGWCSNTGSGSDSPQASQETDAGFVPVGALADVVAYSFGGSKLLSAGNGGAVVTRDPRVAARLKSYVDRPSDAYAFSALQSAVLLPQLSTLRNYNERRTAMAVRMNARDWRALNAQPACEINADVPAAIYKYALVANSQPQAGRDHLIEQLRRIGLPVGKGFRSLHATSPRRSSKPVPLQRSQVLGENCVVIDHRALLADNLIERLKQVET